MPGLAQCRRSKMTTIPNDIMGDVWPENQPGSDGANYVTATGSIDVHLKLQCEPYPHQPNWKSAV